MSAMHEDAAYELLALDPYHKHREMLGEPDLDILSIKIAVDGRAFIPAKSLERACTTWRFSLSPAVTTLL